MPTKRVKYTTPIQFFPNLSKDIIKDDPSESQNTNIPDEPEHFKYGIYFNDGYDYMRHMVSLDDFRDEEKDLKTLVTENKPPVNIMPTKSATVIKEFEVNDINCEVNEENLKKLDNTTFEKLKEIAQCDVDQDILKALESDGEFSELEDDFVELADNVNQKRMASVDHQLFSRFLGNGSSNFHEQMEDDEDGHANENKNCFDFRGEFSKPINDISDHVNFQNTFSQMKSMTMPNCENSKANGFSKAVIYALEQTEEMLEKKDFIQPVDTSSGFYKNLYKGETEYDEAAVDKALKDWCGEAKPNTYTNAMEVQGKITKNLPKIISIRKRQAVEQDDAMEVAKDIGHENELEITLTDMSQYHVRRSENETSEERRERKKAIKTAKRSRTEEKKILANTFKFAKMR